MFRPSFEQIEQAKSRLKTHLKETSLQASSLGELLNCNLFLKWESEQPVKSFKIRGALNKVLSLTDEERARGLIAASAGNHGQGLALASQIAKVKARVVMMEGASQVKVEACRSFGAEVILQGKTYDESYEHARSIQGDSTFIPAFADPLVIAGQGTIGLEIFKRLPQIDSLVVPVGGGGLISGLAVAIKKFKPGIRIYGVVWEGTPDYCTEFYKNKQASCSCKPATQQGLKSQIGLTDGIAVRARKEMQEIFSSYVDEMTCVTEEEISQAMVKILQATGQTVEGSGAAGLAGALKNKDTWQLGKNCTIIISGANIDSVTFAEVVKKYGES